MVDSGLVPPLIDLLINAEMDIKKEALWAISNATSGSKEQIKYLVDQAAGHRVAFMILTSFGYCRVVCGRCANFWMQRTTAS